MDFWLMIPNVVFTVSAKSETKVANNNGINIGRYFHPEANGKCGWVAQRRGRDEYVANGTNRIGVLR